MAAHNLSSTRCWAVFILRLFNCACAFSTCHFSRGRLLCAASLTSVRADYQAAPPPPPPPPGPRLPAPSHCTKLGMVLLYIYRYNIGMHEILNDYLHLHNTFVSLYNACFSRCRSYICHCTASIWCFTKLKRCCRLRVERQSDRCRDFIRIDRPVQLRPRTRVPH